MYPLLQLFYEGIPYLNQKQVIKIKVKYFAVVCIVVLNQERELLRSEGEAFRDM